LATALRVPKQRGQQMNSVNSVTPGRKAMDQKRYDEGLAVRGAEAEYVDKSVKAPDEFSKPMQDLVTGIAGARSARRVTARRAASSTWRC
jgi:hypothetical protein